MWPERGVQCGLYPVILILEIRRVSWRNITSIWGWSEIKILSSLILLRRELQFQVCYVFKIFNHFVECKNFFDLFQCWKDCLEIVGIADTYGTCSNIISVIIVLRDGIIRDISSVGIIWNFESEVRSRDSVCGFGGSFRFFNIVIVTHNFNHNSSISFCGFFIWLLRRSLFSLKLER